MFVIWWRETSFRVLDGVCPPEPVNQIDSESTTFSSREPNRPQQDQTDVWKTAGRSNHHVRPLKWSDNCTETWKSSFPLLAVWSAGKGFGSVYHRDPITPVILSGSSVFSFWSFCSLSPSSSPGSSPAQVVPKGLGMLVILPEWPLTCLKLKGLWKWGWSLCEILQPVSGGALS